VSINGVTATGTTQVTAFRIPPTGQVFGVDVQVVPPSSGVMMPDYSYDPIACLIRNSGSNDLRIYPLVGGTVNGSAAPYTLSAGSVAQFWALSAIDWVLFSEGSGPAPPYTAPTFSSFSIFGQSSPIEVGAAIAAGPKSFVWTTTQPANVQANSISITDVTTSTLLAAGLANTGSDTIVIGSITNNSPATHTWRIAGVDIQSNPFSRDFPVAWEWLAHWGASALTVLTSSQILALSGSALQTTSPGTYPTTGAGYKFWAVPADFVQPTLFRDSITQFNVPMAADAIYNQTNSSGINYALVSVTNANGVVHNYALYRSLNTSSSNLTYLVT